MHSFECLDCQLGLHGSSQGRALLASAGAGSQLGGLHEMPGSQVTVVSRWLPRRMRSCLVIAETARPPPTAQSVGAGLRAEGYHGSQQQQTGQAPAPWFDSQQSDLGLCRTRKTSIVEVSGGAWGLRGEGCAAAARGRPLEFGGGTALGTQ